VSLPDPTDAGPAPPAARGARGLTTRYSLRTSTGRLRLAAHAEGVSLLLLVCVGVPLKHLLGVPDVVRVLGPVHGVLFVLYLVLLAETAAGADGGGWPPRRAAAAAVASLVPFGTFFLLGPLLDRPRPPA
jgi:integral membrane protein